jgi:uroporphyrinogen III methyltransferase/synthase
MSNLAGKRIVITRPLEKCRDFAAMISDQGAVPICFPVIEIAPVTDFMELDSALQNLTAYDWWVLTSANGVTAVWERFEKLGVEEIPSYVKIACIGPKTAAALETKGVRPDFVPDEYVAEAILPGLGTLAGLKVLLTRADIARPDLPEAIRASGGVADDICAYRTIPNQPHRQALEMIAQGVDVLTFTSPSTVKNLVQILRRENIDPFQIPNNPIIACIGPITARAADAIGLNVDLVAEQYTTEGLLESLLKFNFGEKQ